MAHPIKQRLLVMNGQRILQTQAHQGADWINQSVSKAGALKPGIYNLYIAQPADKSKRYDGVIVHVDADRVYQHIGKNFIIHPRSDFEELPPLGQAKTITYDARGKANVSTPTIKLGRSRSR
jgi:hypothetical protein